MTVAVHETHTFRWGDRVAVVRCSCGETFTRDSFAEALAAQTEHAVAVLKPRPAFDQTQCSCGHRLLYHPRGGACLTPEVECGCIAFSMWDPREGWIDLDPETDL